MIGHCSIWFQAHKPTFINSSDQVLWPLHVLQIKDFFFTFQCKKRKKKILQKKNSTFRTTTALSHSQPEKSWMCKYIKSFMTSLKFLRFCFSFKKLISQHVPLSMTRIMVSSNKLFIFWKLYALFILVFFRTNVTLHN